MMTGSSSVKVICRSRLSPCFPVNSVTTRTLNDYSEQLGSLCFLDRGANTHDISKKEHYDHP
jgi:hypothetical protein